jgi:hypothetical protein
MVFPSMVDAFANDVMEDTPAGSAPKWITLLINLRNELNLSLDLDGKTYLRRSQHYFLRSHQIMAIIIGTCFGRTITIV